MQTPLVSITDKHQIAPFIGEFEELVKRCSIFTIGELEYWVKEVKKDMFYMGVIVINL